MIHRNRLNAWLDFTLVSRQIDLDKLHSALTGTIFLIFPHRDLPRKGACRHNPCDGVRTPTLCR
jgi:hypothetical protein